MALLLAAGARGADRVKVAGGTIKGRPRRGVRAFLGIPFAAPPVGDLRWAAPQPVKKWTGVRETKQFGPRCMQQSLFSDMVFRSNGMSEDCLYLNVWTPAKSASERLPVLVYFFGGGYVAGEDRAATTAAAWRRRDRRFDGELPARHLPAGGGTRRNRSMAAPGTGDCYPHAASAGSSSHRGLRRRPIRDDRGESAGPSR